MQATLFRCVCLSLSAVSAPGAAVDSARRAASMSVLLMDHPSCENYPDNAMGHAGPLLRRHRFDLELPLGIEQLATDDRQRGPMVAKVFHTQSNVRFIVAWVRQIEAQRHQVPIVHVRCPKDGADVLPDDLALFLE